MVENDNTLPSIEKSLWRPKILQRGNIPFAGQVITSFNGLDAEAKGLGHITCDADSDGIYRRFPLLFAHKNGVIPALALKMVCDELQVPEEQIEIRAGESILLRNANFDGVKKDITIPIDSFGRMVINYPGKWSDKKFPHISVSDILFAANDDDLLDQLADTIEGSLIILSDTSVYSHDFGATPIEKQFILSGLHFNIINSVLQDSFISEWKGPSRWGYEISLVLLVILASIFLGKYLSFFSLFLFFSLDLIFTVWLFSSKSILVDFIHFSIFMITVSIGVSFFRYLFSEKEKLRLKHNFQSFMAPAVLDKILSKPDLLNNVQRKELTILFSDIKNFTGWSSKQSPQEIHDALNIYFDEMTQIIFKYEGTIDKFIGDGLMVFFGDPLDQPDHAHRATQAAIEMQKACRHLKPQMQKDFDMDLEIRIGIHSGEVTVGNMGSTRRMDYTVIGSVVNIAARLEGAAPVGGVLISQHTKSLLPSTEHVKPHDRIHVKGIDEELEVFELCL